MEIVKMVFAKAQTIVFLFSGSVEVTMLRRKNISKEILSWETKLFLHVYEQTKENG